MRVIGAHLPARRIYVKVRTYGNLAGWVTGCLSVCHTPVLYQNGLLKLFPQPGNPIILVSSDPCVDIKFQGESFKGAINTRGGKIGDLRRKSPFISETVRDRPMITMER